jgi:hypothetical protein
MKVYVRSVIRFGTSIGITLPFKFAKKNKITENSRIAIFQYDDRLEIRRLDEEQLKNMVMDNSELLETGVINEAVLLERAERLKEINQKNKDE